MTRWGHAKHASTVSGATKTYHLDMSLHDDLVEAVLNGQMVRSCTVKCPFLWYRKK